MISVQQHHEYHHQNVLIESFHLSCHTFRFRWTVQDLVNQPSFLGLVKFVFGSNEWLSANNGKNMSRIYNFNLRLIEFIVLFKLQFRMRARRNFGFGPIPCHQPLCLKLIDLCGCCSFECVLHAKSAVNYPQLAQTILMAFILSKL